MLKPGRGGGEDGTDADAEADAQRRLAALVQTAESMEQDAHMQPDQVAAAAWTDAGGGLEGRKRGRQESDVEGSPDRWRRKSAHAAENPEWVHKTMEQYIALQMLTMVADSCSFLFFHALSCSSRCPLCFPECI